MSSEIKEVPKRERKPKARHWAIVLGAIHERVSSISGNAEHTSRLHELLDELRRALSAMKEPTDE